ncbi:MAG: hypothetical protein ACRDFX_08075 [Chloroflexota bacterium]
MQNPTADPFPRVHLSAEASALIHHRGGSIWVWPSRHRCCSGELTLLEASTRDPERESMFLHRCVDGISIYIQPPSHEIGASLQLDVRGVRRKRIEAAWNGCAFVL